MRRLVIVIPVVAFGLAVAACNSPEASRTRGGGAGADPGNRGQTVDLHGKTEMFHGTPQRAPGR